MKNIVLVYPPFCTPASPPYSITNIFSFLRKNLGKECSVNALDLNLEFHLIKFEDYGRYFRDFTKNYSAEEYSKIAKEFLEKTEETYSESNKSVVKGDNPELFEDMLAKIMELKPDIVGFSVVYSSQAFFTLAFMKALRREGIKTVIGGPAVNSKLIAVADTYLQDEKIFLEFITGTKTEKIIPAKPDFSIYDLKKYFSPFPIIPVKTSSTCFYKQCTFCTHHRKTQYEEYKLEKYKKEYSYFIIDDMISKKRLLEIASCMNSPWTCQLRPTKDLDYELFVKLRESGLKSIMWGVESGSDRILGLIRKGTNTSDIRKVLADSHRAGIKNVIYIIFGFPSETKDEFIQTIKFLEDNSENIDLVSTSIFGLQEGTYICSHPEEFGITSIKREERTVLEPKISYEVSSGMTQKEASKMRDRYKKTIQKMNKFPKYMNFFREHMLCLD